MCWQYVWLCFELFVNIIWRDVRTAGQGRPFSAAVPALGSCRGRKYEFCLFAAPHRRYWAQSVSGAPQAFRSRASVHHWRHVARAARDALCSLSCLTTEWVHITHVVPFGWPTQLNVVVFFRRRRGRHWTSSRSLFLASDPCLQPGFVLRKCYIASHTAYLVNSAV